MISVLTSYVDRAKLRPLPPGGHLMLDSGAYGAMTRGHVVELAALCDWYRQVSAERYAALDVIYDPEVSRANALAQRTAGLEVVPVVHCGTSPAEVDRLATDGFTSVGFGGLVRRTQRKPDMLGWLAACLDRAAAAGMAAHGFAFSPLDPKMLPLLMRFASVDSTAWTSQYGYVWVWDGGRLRQLDGNTDRLEIKRLTRTWPVDPSAWLTRGTYSDAGGLTRFRRLISAASFLAYGEWLMARGGPRLYLAGYHVTGSCRTPEADEHVARILASLTPGVAA